MPPFIISFLDSGVVVEAPASLVADLAAFFPHAGERPATASERRATVTEDRSGGFTLRFDGGAAQANLAKGEVLYRLASAVGRDSFLAGPSVALRAAAVGWDEKAALIVSAPGGGKSSLAAWFVDKGFAYVADDSVVLPAASPGIIAGFPEGLAFRAETLAHIASLSGFHAAPSVRVRERLLVQPEATWLAADAALPCGLIIDVHFESGAALHLEPRSVERAVLRVLEATRRVVLPSDPEYRLIVALAAGIPSLHLTYGHYDQLTGLLDFLARGVLESETDPEEFAAFVAGLGRTAAPIAPLKAYSIPPASDRRFSPKLTIGMATYDDFDGVYFSIQSIRLFHPEVLADVEFLVIDNHPDGPCAQALKDLEGPIANYRYVPFEGVNGTSAPRDLVFAEAGGELVLCMDCHVLLVPGALRRLLDWFAANPATSDLLQGPMLRDDGASISTHFKPEWRAGMYGTWDTDPAGTDSNAAPFEIPMQGLGLFACRRAAWLGFNPRFQGFGGEEGYIHEKFRRAGHRTLCLPFLRWLHRFPRPMGPPYKIAWEDRCRNYTIGFREVGLPTEPIEAHFAELLGADVARRIFGAIREELHHV